jgi:hypothetical protein
VQRLPTHLLTLAGCLVLWGLAGCGGPKDELNRQGVTGKVTFNGQPLKTGTVEFSPQGSGATTGGGATVTDGEFSIAAERGLPPGTYLVRISSAGETAEPAEALPGESNVVAKELIPASWNTESTHTVTVKDGEENAFTFDVK